MAAKIWHLFQRYEINITMANNRLGHLECLRAACALMVFCSHLYVNVGGIPHHAILDMMFNWATEAVVGFFVLSGCVISLQRYVGVEKYLKARFIRILPIYYLVLALTVAATLVCQMKLDVGQLVGNALFLQTVDSLDLVGPMALNPPLWSLSYEMFYYLAFTLILLVPKLLIPFFIASFGLGVSMYFFVKPHGLPGTLLEISHFFCIWLVGVLVTKFWISGRAASLATGAFMLTIGLCLARASFSSAFYDFGRLFCLAIGFGVLVSALLAVETKRGDPSVITLDLGVASRLAISGCSLLILWSLSSSFLETKIILTGLVVFSTITPGSLVRFASTLLRPVVPFLLYIGGLSYALYLVHYPLLKIVTYLALFSPAIALVIVAILAVGLAHVLDYRFQPWIKSRLTSADYPARDIRHW